jgi:hypothetical protein
LGVSIEGDASIGRIEDIPIDISFSDILDSLDLGGMIRYEGFKDNRWGVAVDYMFMDLSGKQVGDRGGIAGVEMREGILEGQVMYRFVNGNSTIDVYGALRWWDIDIDVELTPALWPTTRSKSVSADWVDIVIGARGMTPLGKNWTGFARFDIGGLGLSSNITFLGYLGARWLFAEAWTLELGYKALWVDYEEGDVGATDRFAYDTVSHGPLIGIIFTF